jgi:hypothetical protein
MKKPEKKRPPKKVPAKKPPARKAPVKKPAPKKKPPPKPATPRPPRDEGADFYSCAFCHTYEEKPFAVCHACGQIQPAPPKK